MYLFLMTLHCLHRLVVRTSRCGRDNPGSTPGVDILAVAPLVDSVGLLSEQDAGNKSPLQRRFVLAVLGGVSMCYSMFSCSTAVASTPASGIHLHTR